MVCRWVHSFLRFSQAGLFCCFALLGFRTPHACAHDYLNIGVTIWFLVSCWRKIFLRVCWPPLQCASVRVVQVCYVCGGQLLFCGILNLHTLCNYILQYIRWCDGGYDVMHPVLCLIDYLSYRYSSTAVCMLLAWNELIHATANTHTCLGRASVRA